MSLHKVVSQPRAGIRAVTNQHIVIRDNWTDQNGRWGMMDRFTTNDGTTRLTLAQWRNATGQDQHSLVSAPAALFVNAAGNDYHLSAASPAINAGTATSAPPTDLEGDPRPSGGGWDIGADERTVSAVQIVDDGEPRFNSSRTWLTAANVGRDGDFRAAWQGQGAPDVATWTFNAAPGQYRVSATWAPNSQYWATSALFSVLDGTALRGAKTLNQRLAPNDFNDAGSAWENLGTFDLAGSMLTVSLTSAGGNGYVAADGVRIERIGNLSAAPEIQASDGVQPIASGGSVSFGTTEMSHPLSIAGSRPGR